MQNNPPRNKSNQLAKKVVALGFKRIDFVEFETFFLFNEPQSFQVVNRILYEFETLFLINEP